MEMDARHLEQVLGLAIYFHLVVITGPELFQNLLNMNNGLILCISLHENLVALI